VESAMREAMERSERGQGGRGGARPGRGSSGSGAGREAQAGEGQVQGRRWQSAAESAGDVVASPNAEDISAPMGAGAVEAVEGAVLEGSAAEVPSPTV
jgi:hypothetical protein